MSPSVLSMAGTAGNNGPSLTGPVASAGSLAGSALLSSGIGAAGSLIGGILNYWATQDTNRQNYELSQQNRQDTLAQQRRTNTLNNRNFALSERQQSFNENEANLNRTENTEQKGYGRLQSAYQRAADLLTRQMNMNQVAASPFQKYAATGGK